MSVVQTESREGGPSSIAKRLRREGFLPMAILHAKGAPELIKAKMADVKRVLHETPGVGIFTIQMPSDKEPRTMLVKQVDYEPVTKAIIHMTLQEVQTGDTVTLSVPLTPVGENRPATHGAAVLMRPHHHLRIRCHVSEVPHELEVDISDLKIDESILAGDVAVPEGVEVLNAPTDVMFFLKAATKEELPPETEATDVADAVAEATTPESE